MINFQISSHVYVSICIRMWHFVLKVITFIQKSIITLIYRVIIKNYGWCLCKEHNSTPCNKFSKLIFHIVSFKILVWNEVGIWKSIEFSNYIILRHCLNICTLENFNICTIKTSLVMIILLNENFKLKSNARWFQHFCWFQIDRMIWYAIIVVEAISSYFWVCVYLKCCQIIYVCFDEFYFSQRQIKRNGWK